ncbi:MAG: hypothetical protein JSW15_06455 [Deltaproteobacteria bacterium]|nr:MAG: hypothetical protein JSW15_06455 [Deltaproteobacteria bacterium]
MKLKKVMRWFFICGVAAMVGMLSSEVRAIDLDFHGYFESNVILRDSDSFRYGFMDQLEVIQQRNTLKFDVDAYTRYDFGPFRLDKIHLTYRGGYDSVFKLRDDEYEGIPAKRGESRFDKGLDDIEYENDLREASLDVTYQGPLGSFFFRPGRQLVSWGEVSGATIIDVIHPSDVSFQISAFPDELKTPLWMGRFNYSIPPQPSFNLNLDAIVIPDVRPLQLPPLDATTRAPYIRNTSFKRFGLFYGMPSFTGGVVQEVPTQETEYGARLMVDIGANLSVCAMYFKGYNDSPGVVMDINPGVDFMADIIPWVMAGQPLDALPPIATKARLTHPQSETYGGSFNYYVNPPIDIVLKGEIGYTTDSIVNHDLDAKFLPDVFAAVKNGSPYWPPGTPNDPNVAAFSAKDKYSWMIGFDKKWWARWFSPAMLSTSFQWIHVHIKDFEDFLAVNNKEDTDWITGQLVWFWVNGRVQPAIFVIYDTVGTWMTNVSVDWTITKNWKASVGSLSFHGSPEKIGQFSNAVYHQGMYDGTDQILCKLLFQW